MSLLITRALEDEIKQYFKEDDLSRNIFYTNSLPDEMVSAGILFKDDMVIAGLPYFFETLKFLGAKFSDDELKSFYEYEGREVTGKVERLINFRLPLSIALTGERIALNLLQHASSIATSTRKFSKLAEKTNTKIIDTRKTTPGHRALEKYSVRVGGGFNHRFGQTDMFMVKDNHKEFFGGLVNAVNFFKDIGGMYTPIEVEIHDINELEDATKLGIKHVMLDNFSPAEVKKAVAIKPENMTYEVSGGITMKTINDYLVDGVDAISLGALTYDAPHVDISFKYNR